MHWFRVGSMGSVWSVRVARGQRYRAGSTRSVILRMLASSRPIVHQHTQSPAMIAEVVAGRQAMIAEVVAAGAYKAGQVWGLIFGVSTGWWMELSHGGLFWAGVSGGPGGRTGGRRPVWGGQLSGNPLMLTCHLTLCRGLPAVSYTHLTLPTKRRV